MVDEALDKSSNLALFNHFCEDTLFLSHHSSPGRESVMVESPWPECGDHCRATEPNS